MPLSIPPLPAKSTHLFATANTLRRTFSSHKNLQHKTSHRQRPHPTLLRRKAGRRQTPPLFHRAEAVNSPDTLLRVLCASVFSCS